MIDHVAARRLSASAIDFELEAEERHDLDGHLRDCRDCRAATAGYTDDLGALRALDYGPVPVAVRANLAIVAERRERGGGRGWVLLAAAAMLLVVIVGGLAGGVGSRGDGGGGGGVAAPIGRSIGWQTPVVSLQAADFYLEASGRTWVPPADAAVIVDSDPGDRSYWTLEVTWFDGVVEQRMNLYFGSDGAEWWIDEARIYNGREGAEWLTARGPFLRTPIGVAYQGDLEFRMEDLEATGTGPGRIVMRDARLAVAPAGGAAPVPGDPSDPVLVPIDPVSGAAIDCGPADAATCNEIVSQAMTDWGNRGITLIQVTSASGDHEIHFADGDVVATIGN